MASLRARTQRASVHVLDHALAQRADNIGTHGQLLSGMRLMTPRSSRQDATAAIDDLHPGHRAHNRAVRLSELSRSDLVLWPRRRLLRDSNTSGIRGKADLPGARSKRR